MTGVELGETDTYRCPFCVVGCGFVRHAPRAETLRREDRFAMLRALESVLAAHLNDAHRGWNLAMLEQLAWLRNQGPEGLARLLGGHRGRLPGVRAQGRPEPAR